MKETERRKREKLYNTKVHKKSAESLRTRRLKIMSDLIDKDSKVLDIGFSGASNPYLTNVVGMDIVKRNIQALRGQIDIRSTDGKGTVFSLRLPLTLAIND